VSLQVEDMLKRSFLEFHAQKAAPEALIAVEKGHAALARLRARTWPVSAAGATRAEVEQYCEMSARIEELSAELQVRRPD
jgi:antiviral helicase SKI2